MKGPIKRVDDKPEWLKKLSDKLVQDHETAVADAKMREEVPADFDF